MIHIDVIDLFLCLNCIGNLVALASIDARQIESMKQPFIHSLFNILEVSRKRLTSNEQTNKQSQMTSIWHPIIGHIRGRTTAITVLVHPF